VAEQDGFSVLLIPARTPAPRACLSLYLSLRDNRLLHFRQLSVTLYLDDYLNIKIKTAKAQEALP
jgi:hypothetical protein